MPHKIIDFSGSLSFSFSAITFFTADDYNERTNLKRGHLIRKSICSHIPSSLYNENDIFSTTVPMLVSISFTTLPSPFGYCSPKIVTGKSNNCRLCVKNEPTQKENKIR